MGHWSSKGDASGIFFIGLVCKLFTVLDYRKVCSMDGLQYAQIFEFLRDGKYPEKFSRQQKWNFRKKLDTFFISESQILYKVNTQCAQITISLFLNMQKPQHGGDIFDYRVIFMYVQSCFGLTKR